MLHVITLKTRLWLIVPAVIVLSTILVRATDHVLLQQWLSGIGSERCEVGAVEFLIDGRVVCVDRFQASAGEQCEYQNPRSQAEHTNNLQQSSCMARTTGGAEPLRYVTYTQAEQYCARSGKRLLTPREWHVIARSLHDQVACVVNERTANPRLTGSVDCVTPEGVHDLVGNVWEWVDAEVVTGTFNGRTLPASGYVQLVDTAGVVVETGSERQLLFDEAYAWVDSRAVGGMVKGGFFGSGRDAGRYAQHLGLPLDTSTAGIGFRCIQDIAR